MSLNQIKAGRAFYDIGADNKELMKKLRESRSAVNKLQKSGRVLANVGAQVRGLGEGVNRLGRRMTLGGVALSTPFILAGKQLSDFERQMASVRVNLGEQIGKDMRKATSAIGGQLDVVKTLNSQYKSLEKTVRRIARNFPVTPTEVAGAASTLARAGLKPSDIKGAKNKAGKQIPGVLEQVVRLKVADTSGAELTEITAKTLSLLKAFNLLEKQGKETDFAKLDRVNRQMAELLKATTQANVSITSLAESMKFAGGIFAKSVNSDPTGKNFREVIAVTSVLQERLGDASIAGTALRGMMLRLQNPPKKVADALRSVDFDFFKKGAKGGRLGLVELLTVFEQFEDAINKGQTSKANYEKFLGGIFENRQITAALSLVDEGAKKISDRVNNIAVKNPDAFFKDFTDELQSNVGGAAGVAKSKLQDLALEIGKSLAPEIEGLIRLLGDAADSLRNFAAKNPALVKLAAAAAAGLAALGVAVTALGAALSTVALPIIAVGIALETLAKPIVGISSAFVGMAGSVKTVARVLKQFKMIYRDTVSLPIVGDKGFGAMAKRGPGRGLIAPPGAGPPKDFGPGPAPSKPFGKPQPDGTFRPFYAGPGPQLARGGERLPGSRRGGLIVRDVGSGFTRDPSKPLNQGGPARPTPRPRPAASSMLLGVNPALNRSFLRSRNQPDNLGPARKRPQSQIDLREQIAMKSMFKTFAAGAAGQVAGRTSVESFPSKSKMTVKEIADALASDRRRKKGTGLIVQAPIVKLIRDLERQMGNVTNAVNLTGRAVPGSVDRMVMAELQIALAKQTEANAALIRQVLRGGGVLTTGQFTETASGMSVSESTQRRRRNAPLPFAMLTGGMAGLKESRVKDLNLDPLEDVAESMKGVIGPAKTKKIVSALGKTGPIGSLDELNKVKGIGPGTVSKLDGLFTTMLLGAAASSAFRPVAGLLGDNGRRRRPTTVSGTRTDMRGGPKPQFFSTAPGNRITDQRRGMKKSFAFRNQFVEDGNFRRVPNIEDKRRGVGFVGGTPPSRRGVGFIGTRSVGFVGGGPGVRFSPAPGTKDIPRQRFPRLSGPGVVDGKVVRRGGSAAAGATRGGGLRKAMSRLTASIAALTVVMTKQRSVPAGMKRAGRFSGIAGIYGLELMKKGLKGLLGIVATVATAIAVATIKFTLIATAIGGFILAGDLIPNLFDNLTSTFSNMFGDMKVAIGQLGDIFGSFKGTATELGGSALSMSEKVKLVTDSIRNVFIIGITNFVQAIPGLIKTLFEALKDGIIGMFRSLGGLFSMLADSFGPPGSKSGLQESKEKAQEGLAATSAAARARTVIADGRRNQRRQNIAGANLENLDPRLAQTLEDLVSSDMSVADAQKILEENRQQFETEDTSEAVNALLDELKTAADVYGETSDIISKAVKFGLIDDQQAAQLRTRASEDFQRDDKTTSEAAKRLADAARALDSFTDSVVSATNPFKELDKNLTDLQKAFSAGKLTQQEFDRQRELFILDANEREQSILERLGQKEEEAKGGSIVGTGSLFSNLASLGLTGIDSEQDEKKSRKDMYEGMINSAEILKEAGQKIVDAALVFRGKNMNIFGPIESFVKGFMGGGKKDEADLGFLKPPAQMSSKDAAKLAAEAVADESLIPTGTMVNGSYKEGLTDKLLTAVDGGLVDPKPILDAAPRIGAAVAFELLKNMRAAGNLADVDLNSLQGNGTITTAQGDELRGLGPRRPQRAVGIDEADKGTPLPKKIENYRRKAASFRGVAPSTMGAPLTGLATGGPVTSGGSYVVGEHGPELFVPTKPGHILSNKLSTKIDGMFADGTNDGLFDKFFKDLANAKDMYLMSRNYKVAGNSQKERLRNKDMVDPLGLTTLGGYMMPAADFLGNTFNEGFQFLLGAGMVEGESGRAFREGNEKMLGLALNRGIARPGQSGNAPNFTSARAFTALGANKERFAGVSDEELEGLRRDGRGSNGINAMLTEEAFAATLEQSRRLAQSQQDRTQERIAGIQAGVSARNDNARKLEALGGFVRPNTGGSMNLDALPTNMLESIAAGNNPFTGESTRTSGGSGSSFGFMTDAMRSLDRTTGRTSQPLQDFDIAPPQEDLSHLGLTPVGAPKFDMSTRDRLELANADQLDREALDRERSGASVFGSGLAPIRSPFDTSSAGPANQPVRRAPKPELPKPGLPKLSKIKKDLQGGNAGMSIGRHRTIEEAAGLDHWNAPETNASRMASRIIGNNESRLAGRVNGTNASRMRDRIARQRSEAISGASVGMPGAIGSITSAGINASAAARNNQQAITKTDLEGLAREDTIKQMVKILSDIRDEGTF